MQCKKVFCNVSDKTKMQIAVISCALPVFLRLIAYEMRLTEYLRVRETRWWTYLRCTRGLVGCLCGLKGLLARLLANDVQHAVFESLLVLRQSVLLPSVVKDSGIEVVSLHALLKEANASSIVRLLLELQRTAILHKLPKFGRMAPAKLLQRRLNLLLLDGIVLLVLATAWQTLPRQRSLDQIKQNVTDGFQIVASTLLDSLVRRYRGISGRASQIFPVLVGYVLPLAVLVALGQAKVDNEDVVSRALLPTDQKVVRLDIAVDYALFMHFFDSFDHL